MKVKEEALALLETLPSNITWADLAEAFLAHKTTIEKTAVEKLLWEFEAGNLMMMQTVNRLYDLERDYNLAPEAIAAHVTDEDIKDNYLAIPRK